MPNKPEKLELLDNVLSKNIGWINTADTKAGFVFLLNTSMLGLLAALISNFSNWTCWSVATTCITILLLGLSLVFLFFVSFPHLEEKYTSSIYFGGIARTEEKKFVKKILEGLTEDILEDFARQCYQTSQIANQKFKNLKWSFRLLYIALIPWLLSLSLLYTQALPPTTP